MNSEASVKLCNRKITGITVINAIAARVPFGALLVAHK
jgi:hypothetical protein